MNQLDQVVFIVQDGKVIETSIREFDGAYIDQTTTPHGVSARYHVRGNELWTWGHQGNFPRRLSTHNTVQDALDAVEDSFAYDFWKSTEILAFPDRAGAEACLSEILEDAES